MVTRADENLLSAGTTGSRSDLNQYFVRGVSATMRALEHTIADLAPTDIPVLLVGESGTGKEVVALEIHRLSKRWNGAFVKCGCEGLTVGSLAARFNYGENGERHKAASCGSLFLDEISHLDPASQARLLEMLPDGTGLAPESCLNDRVISSTTRNLEEEMRAGRFREALYYRINGVNLRLPPLRERKEDLPGLLDFFLKKYASLFGRPGPQLGSATMDQLLQHSWPGNIRELENIARKIVALGNDRLAIADLAPVSVSRGAESELAPTNGNGQAPSRSLKQASREASRQAEREIILEQLQRTRWNRKKTARDLQISYKALLYKLKQLGLDSSNGSNGQ